MIMKSGYNYQCITAAAYSNHNFVVLYQLHFFILHLHVAQEGVSS
uniref:Uncharacterized protein n=1 Tax=Anguilla anguilla TaxID=7936 RepID=A0A0E9QVE4_ANGAN